MNNNSQIFIVDDDADDRQIIKDAFLENNEINTIHLFEHGQQLLDFLNNEYDSRGQSLILLDLNMPGRDGREALKIIKSDARFHHIPVVVFTTSSLPRDRIMAYELGANCFLTKPSAYLEIIDIADTMVKLWLHP